MISEYFKPIKIAIVINKKTKNISFFGDNWEIVNDSDKGKMMLKQEKMFNKIDLTPKAITLLLIILI